MLLNIGGFLLGIFLVIGGVLLVDRQFRKSDMHHDVHSYVPRFMSPDASSARWL